LNKIIPTLFAELDCGRLARLPFLLYVTCLHLSLVVFMLWVGVSAGLTEHAANGDLAAAEQALSDWMSVPTLTVSAIFLLSVTFVNFNLLAKRIRDMGLPGWISLLVYVVLRAMVGAMAGLGLDLLLMTVLCFVATGAFKREPR
jgi:uncharacterized membrane protein YhaH (DUF805 family)